MSSDQDLLIGLAKDVRDVLERAAVAGNIGFENNYRCVCQSPSLRLTKYASVGLKDNGEKEVNKASEIKAVINCPADAGEIFDPSESKARSDRFVTVYARTGDRLMVNMAGGMLENANICLHPHFGYPYIPGSAVKGCARRAAWSELQEVRSGVDREAIEAFEKRMRLVFGSVSKDPDEDFEGGRVCFFPATPEGKRLLEADVLTCHHPDYYGGRMDEALDTENPNPQFFPAVKKGTLFRFRLAPVKIGVEDPQALMNDAERWLRQALMLYGIGAKTAAGYGWFIDETDEQNERNKIMKEKADKAERQKEQKERLKQRLETLNPDRTDALSPEEAELLKAVKEDLDTYTGSDAQLFREMYYRIAKHLPKESPVDRIRRLWEGKKKTDDVFKDRTLKNFSKLSPEEKQAVITLLKDASFDRGREVFVKLKGGVKKFPGPERQAILDEMKK